MIHNITKSGVWAVAALAFLSGCSEAGDGIVVPSPVAKTGDYAISIGTAATRAQLDGNTYLWSPGDRVGFYMAHAGTTDAFASNVKLTGTNTLPATSAEFEGEISEVQIGNLGESGSYDYYAYYPYSASTGGTFPDMTFDIPTLQTVYADGRDAVVFMTARLENKDALTYLLPDGRQYFTRERVNFAFEHRVAYMDIYLAENVMSQKVTMISVTDLSGGVLAGGASVNLQSGVVTSGSGSNQVMVNIPDGIEVNSPDVRVAVMPREFASGTKLKFIMELENGTTSETEVDVSGKKLEPGKNHRIGLRALAAAELSISYNGGFKSSYDYYRAGDKATANSMDGSTIYGSGANAISYTANGVSSAKISEIGLLLNGERVPAASWDKLNQTFTVDNRTVTWGDHSVQLYLIHTDGREVRSETKTVSVTGLPYYAAPPTEGGGWSKASWNVDFKGDCVRLGGTSGSGECTATSPSFHIPANIDIDVETYSFIRASQIIWWQTTTFTVIVNGTDIISKDSGRDKNGTFYTLNGNGTLTPSGRSVSCKSSYAAAGPYVEVYNIRFNYR